MAKILLAWEYGGGFGHVAMLVPLALRLRAEGHEPILALRDIRTAASLWKDTGLQVVQAPFIPLPTSWDKTIRTDTLADVFALGGLIHARKLTALAHAWQKMLTAIKPELVICEFSPTLSMVTLGQIPTLTIGTGFSIPPAGRTLPSIRFWDESISENSIRHEQELHKAITEVRQVIGLAPPAFFADLFSGDASFVCVLPELDCYGKYRTTPAIGPLTAVPSPSFAPTAATIERQAFAYLAGEEDNLYRLLSAIHQSGISCDAYLRRIDHSKLPQDHSIYLHDTPQSLTDILPKRRILIHHGGMSTSDIALRLGIPQLVLSRHLEQKTTGGLLMRAGVAELLMAHHQPDIDRLPDIAKSLANSDAFYNRARKKAVEIASRQQKPAIEVVTETCMRLITS